MAPSWDFRMYKNTILTQFTHIYTRKERAASERAASPFIVIIIIIVVKTIFL